MPIFIEENNAADTMQIPIGASDIESLEDQIVEYHTNQRLFAAMANRQKRREGVNKDLIRQGVREDIAKNPWLFIDHGDDFFDHRHAYMRLNIDDDIGPDVQTLTTLWQTYMQRGDMEKADKILRKIMAIQGKNLAHLTGLVPKAYT